MKRKNRDTPGRRIAQAIIAEYKPQSVAESALKGVFGPMFEAMLNGERMQASESKHAWMQIFDELKSRGGSRLYFNDGVSGT